MCHLNNCNVVIILFFCKKLSDTHWNIFNRELWTYALIRVWRGSLMHWDDIVPMTTNDCKREVGGKTKSWADMWQKEEMQKKHVTLKRKSLLQCFAITFNYYCYIRLSGCLIYKCIIQYFTCVTWLHSGVFTYFDISNIYT